MGRKVFAILSVFILFVIPLISNLNTAFADTGDFYDRHEEEFDNATMMSPDFITLVEDYDYETNSFDCGWVDFNCKINGPIYSWTLGLLKGSFSGGDEAVVTPYDIMGNPVFDDYKSALQQLSIWMLAIFVMWQIMKVVAMRFADADDGMVALNDKVIKIFAFSILLGLYNPIFELIMQFQQYATQAVMDNPVDVEDVAVSLFIYGGAYGFFMALMVAGIMLVFQLAFMYRFVLFGLLYITGVIAIPTGMNDEYDYFSVWLRLMITNGVTLFLQALTFSLGLQALFVQNVFNRGTAFITAMAFFILALTIPALLGQLGSSSGSGKAIGSVARVASRRLR